MATYNLGRILPIFRGAWSPSKSYDKLDVVTFEGSSYMAISDNTNKRPDENPSAWILSAAKGDPGEPGKDGPTYKPGVGISIVNDVISATGGGEGGGFYFGGFGVEIDENTNSINAEVRAENDMPTRWQLVTMTGLPLDVADDFECKNVFHYKGKTYYSAGLNKNYVLDVLSWEKVEWVGVEIYGEDIFVDAKGDMYYFHGNQYMKYDEDLEAWPPVSINITNAYGRYMFVGKNGYSYYSENRNKTYKIKAGNITTWEKVTVNQDCPATFIWEDETSTYYSNGATHFFYDYENDRWRTQRWAGVNALFGNQIWKQGSHIFFSADSGATYVKKESKWEFVYSLSNLSGDYVFADGENVFSFVDNRAKQLVIPEPFYVTRHGDKLATEEFVTKNGVVQNDEGFVNYKFIEISDAGLPPNSSAIPFYYKGDIYLTTALKQYKYDFSQRKFVFTGASIVNKDVDWTAWYFDEDRLITNTGSSTQSYEFKNGSWVISEDVIRKNAVFGKDAYVYPTVEGSTNIYYHVTKEGSITRLVFPQGTAPSSLWSDYEGNLYVDEYKMLDNGATGELFKHPEVFVTRGQGGFIWTDCNGLIRLDSPDFHKILVGTGDNLRWIDAYYSSDSSIPVSKVSTVSYINNKKFYISYTDRYKTNKKDYLATYEDLNAKIGDIENLLKTI